MNLSASAPEAASAPGHLRSPAFDGALVAGVLVLALALGTLGSLGPQWFVGVVSLNIWLFATPHAICTYTRVRLDGQGLRQHWFLLLVLPLLVLLGNAFIAFGWGAGGLFTVYFIAQTWHYTRQSYGVARAYRHAGGLAQTPQRLADAAIYLLPLAGLLHRCAQQAHTFYDYPLYLPTVPAAVADTVGVAAGVLVAVWSVQAVGRWRIGHVGARHDQFVASHLVVTGVAYWLCSDITAGWLFINLWHNMQYLLFVWAQNVRRHQGRVQGAQQPWVAWLSQPQHAWAYAAFCLLAGAATYAGLALLGQQLLWTGLPMVLVLLLTLNFHHYLMDGAIWKRRATGL